jgi:hypothetical protein
MRIKIIGENNCARATRHLLRLAGFAVTDFLPADAVLQGPAAGYAITIELYSDRFSDFDSRPVSHCVLHSVSDSLSDRFSDLSPAAVFPNSLPGPERATQQQKSSANEEADRVSRDASSFPSFSSMGKPFLVDGPSDEIFNVKEAANETAVPTARAGEPTIAGASSQAGGGTLAGYIHFDSVDSALEAAVLRHVSQLAAGPVIVDRPGGVVRSERELRIVAPCSGDARADEAAAVAIEFGVLRGLLDLVAPDARGEMRWNGAGRTLLSGGAEKTFAARSRKKMWWPFAVVLLGAALGGWNAARGNVVAAAGTGSSGSGVDFLTGLQESTEHRVKPVPLEAALLSHAIVEAGTEGHRLKPVLLGGAAIPEPQGQFATGSGVKITDGVNFLVVDPCQGQAKFYASINQTSNTQLVAGTVSKKIYVCSIHVVAATATDVAVVEGTGSVCATGTAGVSGFGGATAATGWNFAANGGIALGSGESSLGAEGTSGDNLCIFNSGSGQVSGGISYVVE